jgi:hypothetical protein
MGFCQIRTFCRLIKFDQFKKVIEKKNKKDDSENVADEQK